MEPIDKHRYILVYRPMPLKPHQPTVHRQGNFLHSAYYTPFRSNVLHIPFETVCILPSAFRNSTF